MKVRSFARIALILALLSPSGTAEAALCRLEEELNAILANEGPFLGPELRPLSADARQFTENLAGRLVGHPRRLAESTTERQRNAFGHLIPDPRVYNGRGLRGKKEIESVLSDLLVQSPVLDYIPYETLDLVRATFQSDAVMHPEAIFKQLASVADDPAAIAAFEGELRRLLQIAQAGGRAFPTFDPSLSQIGRSEPGRPVIRPLDSRLPYNTIRIEKDGHFEDWTSMSHVDFSRYASREFRVRMDPRSADLRNFPAEQSITPLSNLPEVLRKEVSALYRQPTQEMGLIVLQLRDGTYRSMPVTSGMPDRIEVEALSRALEQVTSQVSPESVRRVQIFHTHPTLPGKVSTTLSSQDVVLAKAAGRQLKKRDIQADVDVFADPVNLEKDGLLFKSTVAATP